jgi:hypothetical protein
MKIINFFQSEEHLIFNSSISRVKRQDMSMANFCVINTTALNFYNPLFLLKITGITARVIFGTLETIYFAYQYKPKVKTVDNQLKQGLPLLDCFSNQEN